MGQECFFSISVGVTFLAEASGRKQHTQVQHIRKTHTHIGIHLVSKRLGQGKEEKGGGKEEKEKRNSPLLPRPSSISFTSGAQTPSAVFVWVFVKGECGWKAEGK